MKRIVNIFIKETRFKKYADSLANNWNNFTKFNPEDKGSLIGLPNPYVVPDSKRYNEMYYWDSYFVIIGLLDSDRFKLAKGMVDNLLYLMQRFGFIPNANRTYRLTRSQPPYLTSMIKEVFQISDDKKWLERAFVIAKKEYLNVWCSSPRKTKIGLSRYYDKRGENVWAEHESGWDHTPRFEDRATEICPVDLNCNLFKYETDFAFFSSVLDKEDEAKKWEKKAEQRKKLINKYMWSQRNGLFYDYDFVHKTKMKVKTLAAYYPLWSRLADAEQAEKLRNNLKLFEQRWGLATCDRAYGLKDGQWDGKQWDYPNGWPPLHWIVIKGLKNYHFDADAKRIAHKWMNLCIRIYNKTGEFWEKYDVVNGEIGLDDKLYITLSGFGWTDAVFIALAKEF
jgi:alpha,alpha-trehalase